jgi:hypothetical protein
VERVDEEGLNDAVHAQQVEVVDLLVEAALGAARAGGGDVVAFGAPDEGEGDEDFERVVEA